VVTNAIVLVPSVELDADAASAARLRDGEIAMAATAAPAEMSALLRVMEEKVWVISVACGFFVEASGDTEFV
jgi:hypothetical protein